MTDGESCTLVQLNDLYRGLKSSSKKVIFYPERDLKTMGVGKKFSKKDVEAILFGMQAQHIIKEQGKRGKMGFMVTKVDFGDDGPSVEHGHKRFVVEVSKPKTNVATKAKASPKKKAAKKKKVRICEERSDAQRRCGLLLLTPLSLVAGQREGARGH